MKIVRPINTDTAATFTRASTATYYNNLGILASAAINVARLNYVPNDLTVPPAYLVEKTATNSLLYSAQLDNAAWVVAGATVTANTVTSPDNTTTADTLTGSGGLSQRSIYQTNAASVTGKTFSIYVKAGTNNFIQLSFGTATSLYANFNLQTRQVGNVSSEVTANIVAINNGWYRCSLTTPSQVAGNVYVSLVTSLTAACCEPNTLTTTVYLWGAQSETGAFTTSYIPTTTTGVTRSADSYSAGVFSNVPLDATAIYAAGTTYAAGNRVRIETTTVHKIYESLVAANVGNDPLTSPTKWVFVYATNQFQMFDGSNSSQTTNAEVIAVMVSMTSLVDTIGTLNISASKIRIVQNTVDGVSFDKTVNLTSTRGITDWYKWFWEPIVRSTDALIENLPKYNNSSVAITIYNPANTTKCGTCVLGFQTEIGTTQYSAKVGILDYSIKTKDAYGNYNMVPRAFSKINDFIVHVESNYVDQLQALLASYRSVPILYIGSNAYGSTMIFGYYKDFSIDIAYFSVSICTIKIEGLT